MHQIQVLRNRVQPNSRLWLKQQSILKWLLRWHDGKVSDTRNLQRAARRAQIEDPLSLTWQDVEERLNECLEELFKLKHQAPELRRKHLRWRLSLAKRQGDAEAEVEIARIARAEEHRKRQQRINRVIRDGTHRDAQSSVFKSPRRGTCAHSQRKPMWRLPVENIWGNGSSSAPGHR